MYLSIIYILFILGLPSHAESAKFQKISFESKGELTILESNTFKGIPMADYFRVDTLWCVKQVAGGAAAVDVVVTGEVRPLTPHSDKRTFHMHTLIIYTLTTTYTLAQVVFLYSTWLKGSIESNTYSELDDVFASWRDAAAAFLGERALALPSGGTGTGMDATLPPPSTEVVDSLLPVCICAGMMFGLVTIALIVFVCI